MITKRRLLVIGIDVASIAASAKRSGYNVYAVDYFGDQDTKASTKFSSSQVQQVPRKSCGRISENFSPRSLVELAQRLTQQYPVDGILLASGFEDCPEELNALSHLAPILGNPLEVTVKVRDSMQFFDTLAKKHIRFPKTVKAKGIEQAQRAACQMNYPLIVKPAKGFGGGEVQLIHSTEELNSASLSEEVLVQEYVRGTAASASIIGNGKDSVVLTLNEQLLGIQQLGASGQFTYCGNIVPLEASQATLRTCESICIDTSNAFGLVGSNGVDFVLDESGKPWVVEVNPRFQGTMECVEKTLGINLVEAHIEACNGRLITPPKESHNFFTRIILYAHRRCSVPDLSVFTEVRDIPFPNVVIERGEPICSVLTEGKTRAQSLDRAQELAGQIYTLLSPEPESP